VDSALKAHFERVDRTADPAGFAAYLDATRASALSREVKRRRFELLAPRPGGRVRRAGCGTGDDVLALSRLAGPGGRAVGVDASATMLAANFVQMDARRLALADAAFDGVRGKRRLQHVPDPAAVPADVARIARPGAGVVVREADRDPFAIDAPDHVAGRAMQRFICDGCRNGRIGHESCWRFGDRGWGGAEATPPAGASADLVFVARAFGLPVAEGRAAAAGAGARQRAADWLAPLAAADEAGRFWCAVGGVLAIGRKPR
jgi:SAM-dependent methyltransferase